ncbi:uncharacterized protein LOC131936201 [Physella acuta]|uniref:uncharacterized protein LOC131936201 n=1 Tax=Physella acuta TaxID=109671 RepID=UPI0027DB249D|nr:uncharacterized protein LOC131936201 [Physella acuta]
MLTQVVFISLICAGVDSVTLTINNYRYECNDCLKTGHPQVTVYGQALTSEVSTDQVGCQALYADVCTDVNCSREQSWSWICMYSGMCGKIDCSKDAVNSHSYESSHTHLCQCRTELDVDHRLRVTFELDVSMLQVMRFRFRWADTENQAPLAVSPVVELAIVKVWMEFEPSVVEAPYLIIHGHFPSCYQCIVLERDPVVLYWSAVYGPDYWWQARTGLCYGVYLDVCYADDVMDCENGRESWYEKCAYNFDCNKVRCGVTELASLPDSPCLCMNDAQYHQLYIYLNGTKEVARNMHYRLRWTEKSATDVAAGSIAFSNVVSIKELYDFGHLVDTFSQLTTTSFDIPGTSPIELSLIGYHNNCTGCIEFGRSVIHLFWQLQSKDISFRHRQNGCFTIYAEKCFSCSPKKIDWEQVCTFASICNNLRCSLEFTKQVKSHTCQCVYQIYEQTELLILSFPSNREDFQYSYRIKGVLSTDLSYPEATVVYSNTFQLLEIAKNGHLTEDLLGSIINSNTSPYPGEKEEAFTLHPLRKSAFNCCV